MSKGTTLRNVRVDSPLWEAAQKRAAAEETDVSSKIRELLRAWVESPPK